LAGASHNISRTAATGAGIWLPQLGPKLTFLYRNTSRWSLLRTKKLFSGFLHNCFLGLGELDFLVFLQLNEQPLAATHPLPCATSSNE
jgi:hypothetical protein